MKYDGIIDEILFYGERSENGRWVIPISVDWDFTITKCSNWDEGTMDVNPDALRVMKEWSEKYNVGWILDTMRPDNLIEEPLKILEENNVKMYGIRRNPQQEMHEPKIFAVMSIDDRCLGIPLRMYDGCNRPSVDWDKIAEIGEPILKKINEELNKK